MKEPQEYWNRKAIDLKKEGKFEEAVKMLDKIKTIKKHEKDDNFWYKKALHYLDIGEFDQSKQSLEKHLENNPQSYDSFFLMGKILFNLKKYEQSLEFYNKAFEEFSRLQLRNSSKVDLMKNVGKFEEAVKYADKIYQQKDIDDKFWYFKGLTLLKLDKYGESSSCFQTILHRDPKNTQILYALAKSELFSGDKKNAINTLLKACSLDSKIRDRLREDPDFVSIYREKLFQAFS